MKNLSIILFIFLVSIVIGNSNEYHVDKSNKNSVKFISETPVENFDGKTSKIDGYFICPSIEKLVGSELYFEVDLNSVDTGIGLRNRHERIICMQLNIRHLQVKCNAKVNDTEYDVKVKGKMFVHGVTKEISVSGKIYKLGEGYKLKSNFEIKLTDYNIKVPKFMFVRISEDIKLYLDFVVKLAE
ncbi:hypothetical protein MASR1M45_24890 [Candidatus Kapaibacterium sp.]